MSLNARIKAQVLAFDAAAQPLFFNKDGTARSALNGYAYEFLLFGLKQAWASLFGATILVMLVATHLFWPADAAVARYDALFVGALAMQAVLLATRLERWDEACVILVFHLVGTAMEIFKTAHGSWSYPEPAVLRIGGAPLFAGFMYAAVGSYIARAWRLMDLRFVRYPPLWGPWVLAAGSYANFFAHHYLPDIRIGLYVLSVVLFGRAWFVFTPARTPRRMPMLMGFGLVALFIWFAENIATFAGAWIYPSQKAGWTLVSPTKLGAWYLLMMLSFVLVTLVHRPRRPGEGEATNPLS